MAITNGYATLEEVKSYISIADTSDDAEVELAVESASRAVDEYCGRFFYQSDSATYLYTADSLWSVQIDDLRTVTSVKTDTAGDGTFDTTWTTDDYVLEPFNAANTGRPYTNISVGPAGNYSFPPYLTAVQVVGNFGWDSVPKPVRQATIRLSTLFFKTAKEGAAPIITMDGATMGMSSRYMDGHAQVLLNPYRRGGVAPGLALA